MKKVHKIMSLKKINEEVFFTDDEIVKVSHQDIEFLKQKAMNNERKRVRLCSHKGLGDKLHEMLIIHTKDTYVRPHKHLGKSESLHVIEGAADVVIYGDRGDITEVIQIGDYKSGLKFYYRISKPKFHNLIITTDFFVFHETTNGPFNKIETVFASWAPDERDYTDVTEFIRRVKGDVKKEQFLTK